MTEATSAKKSDSSHRTGKAMMNAVASALDYGSRLLVSFFVKPVLLAGLGTYGYGVWEVLSKLVGYLAPATGRAGHALRWTTAQMQSSKDHETKRRSVGSAVAVSFVMSPLFMALAAALSWLVPSWLDSPTELVWPIRIAAFLLGVNVGLAGLVEIPRSVLEGENLGYKRMGVSAALVSIGGLLTAGAVWLDMGLIGIAAATVVTSLLTGALFLQVVARHVDWFGVCRPSGAEVRRFLGLSGWFVSWQMIMRLLRSSDVIVLGVLASAEWVTFYSLTKYAPETAINLVAIVVFGVMPGLGGIIGDGEFQRAARIRVEILSLTWSIATAAGITILIWNHAFITLWVGREFYAGPIATLLLVVMVTQFVVIRTDSNIIDLTLDLRRKVILGLLSAMISLTLSAALVGWFDLGITGLCLGSIVGRLVLSVAYPWIIGCYLGVSWTSQVSASIRPILVSSLLFSLAIWAGDQLVVGSWGMLILGLGTTLVLVPLPVLLLGVRGEIRETILRRVLKVAKSRTSTLG